MKRILFVCTGNTCRSPMAEAMMRQIADEQKMKVGVKSAGIAAQSGINATTYAVEALEEKGIQLDHQAKLVELAIIEWADIIFTMTHYHKQVLIHDFPASIDKVFVLKEYALKNEKVDRLYQQLDQLHIEMAEKRVAIQAEYERKGEPWNHQAEEAWSEAIKPILAKEKDLLNQLDHYTVDQDVIDPFGGTLEEYRRCLQELESSIRIIIEKWK